jgi:hypothetical protein
VCVFCVIRIAAGPEWLCPECARERGLVDGSAAAG